MLEPTPETDDDLARRDSGRLLPHWLSTTLLWGLAGLLGWIVFELTANLELSLVVVCLKFGVHDVANAWWLWWRDNDRRRGVIHALAYLALALWSITVMSFLITGLLAVAVQATHALQRPGMPAGQDAWLILVTVAVFFAASVVGGLTTLGITLAAFALQVRVWLSLGMTPWRRRDEFPPAPDQRNLLPSLFETSLLVATVGLVNFTLATLLVERLRLLAIPGVALSLATLVVVGFRDTIKARVTAATPEECWGNRDPQSMESAEIATGERE